MKRSVYVKVVEEIDHLEFDFKSCVPRLVEIFPKEGEAVLRSVAAQQYQKRIKRVTHSIGSPARRAQLYSEFVKKAERPLKPSGADSIIHDMAMKHRFSPVMLSKIILEEYLRNNSDRELGTKEFKELLKDMMICPFKIPDRTLATEVYLCRMLDDQYGTYSEAIKHCTGTEYETKIKVIHANYWSSLYTTCVDLCDY
jgi:hypothetical protein